MSRFQILICIVLLGLGTYVQAGSLNLFQKPGKYKVIGTLELNKGNLKLIVFRHSLNRVVLNVEWPKRTKQLHAFYLPAMSLVHSQVVMIGRIQKPIHHWAGTIEPESIRGFVPDETRISEGDGFWPVSARTKK